MDNALTLGFLGAGKMATALAGGFLKAGLIQSEHLFASDPYQTALQSFVDKTGARLQSNNVEVVNQARFLILAVKPGQVDSVLEEIKGQIKGHQVLVSIAAGIRIATLERGLPPQTQIVRVMPNTPALVGASASPMRSTHLSARTMSLWFRSCFPPWVWRPRWMNLCWMQ